jgi:hypothetical protein
VITNRILIASGAGQVTSYVLLTAPYYGKANYGTEIALSTMEAEYVALSTSCRDLFPLIDLTNEICAKFNIGNFSFNSTARLHIKLMRIMLVHWPMVNWNRDG